jgi:hypothetical protein
MVVDGFGSSIGLVWIIGSSMLVSFFVLCGTAPLVLCGTTTLVLYGIATLILCGQQPLSSMVHQPSSFVGHTTLCGYLFV